MADPLAQHHRLYIIDSLHSEIRATVHREAGVVVVSLWRDDTCVGSAHLGPAEAGRLAAFLSGGLADMAAEWRPPVSPAAESSPSVPRRDGLRWWVWRRRTARLLASAARRLSGSRLPTVWPHA